MPRGRDVFRAVGTMLCAALSLSAERQTAKKPAVDDYVIRTISRLVLLDVSVKDSRGGFVSGLAKENFTVYEDGKQQVISQFANADVPVTVGIVVDESGSMGSKRPDAITAALAFIRASNPRDEMFVVNFNERARLGLPGNFPFSDDARELRAALWRGPSEGRTALYDAIELALRQLDLGRREKKTLVVISDGGDNVSKHTFEDTVLDVQRSLTTIYTVGIFARDDPERNPGVLERLAHLSGGGVYFPKQLEQVVPVCVQIAKDIRTRYTIGYIPLAEGKSARHIRVAASAPGHEKLIVRTRTNYLYSGAKEMNEAK